MRQLDNRPWAALVPERVATVLGASLWAQAATRVSQPNSLGPREALIYRKVGEPGRRAEWLAGRMAMKVLCGSVLGFPDVECLPDSRGVPQLWRGGTRLKFSASLTHTRRWVVAAMANGGIGVDCCDAVDAPRVQRLGTRAFAPEEALVLGETAEDWAAGWAIKEATLKAQGGGVFSPGLSAVRIRRLCPPEVSWRDGRAVTVALLQLPDAVVAVARTIEAADVIITRN